MVLLLRYLSVINHNGSDNIMVQMFYLFASFVTAFVQTPITIDSFRTNYLRLLSNLLNMHIFRWWSDLLALLNPFPKKYVHQTVNKWLYPSSEETWYEHFRSLAVSWEFACYHMVTLGGNGLNMAVTFSFIGSVLKVCLVPYGNAWR